MFENLTPQPADKILALMQEYKSDTRETKIDLGVGVYKNAQGQTPVMRAIKAAERNIWEKQQSKSYVGLAGDAIFGETMVSLVLGQAVAHDAVARVATPGGTGAVRQAFELARLMNPDVRVFVSNPTWPNHVSILKYLGIEMVPYRYFSDDTCVVDFEAMMTDISTAQKGDIVLLHGCCHNPTGANLSMDQWNAVVAQLQKSGATPMVDIAYQGFGDGLDEDAAATRLMAAELPEVLIAASCSKNFGIYRERTGLLMAVGQEGARKDILQANLQFLNRQNYSFPPDHGEALVAEVLTNEALRADWMAELEEVRIGMLALREHLSHALSRATGSDRFGFVAEHRGMFSRLGVSPVQVERLKTDHAIYMVGDSRMNIAGLNETSVVTLANAVAATM